MLFFWTFYSSILIPQRIRQKKNVLRFPKRLTWFESHWILKIRFSSRKSPTSPLYLWWPHMRLWPKDENLIMWIVNVSLLDSTGKWRNHWQSHAFSPVHKGTAGSFNCRHFLMVFVKEKSLHKENCIRKTKLFLADNPLVILNCVHFGISIFSILLCFFL